MKAMQGKTGWALLLAAAIAFPLVVPNSYFLTVMTLAFIYAIATLGLNLLTGYTGQLNLAHGGFSGDWRLHGGHPDRGSPLPFWLAFALSGVVCMAWLVVGVVSLRLA